MSHNTKAGSKVALYLIAARAQNGVIGREGGLPWRLKDDLAKFRELTRGHPILMGRRTWESLPKRPLPERDHFVLTRDGGYKAPGARVYTSIEPALESAKALAASQGKTAVYAIGGAALYAELIGVADRLYLSEVHAEIPGDVMFPPFEKAAFQQIEVQDFEANTGNDYTFTLRVLERIQGL